jgi:GT2 family glycosyltransferase
MTSEVSVLLTCYNRRDLTDRCLSSFLYAIQNVQDVTFKIYLVDDNSSDGTAELIKNKYPEVNIIHGIGSLFWAGGMRLAWKSALDSGNKYDGYLLVNDDVEFIDSFWNNISFTQQWCKERYGQDGIYIMSVKDKKTNSFTYGGYNFKKMLFKHQTVPVYPSTDFPVPCQVSNANILYVSADVVKNIGIFDSHFTHSLADFDYTLRASEKKIPVIVCPDYGGFCHNDHIDKLSLSIPLNMRIKHLYSIKGIALNEYLYYLRKHFWWKAPYAFVALWVDVLFPFLRRN